MSTTGAFRARRGDGQAAQQPRLAPGGTGLGHRHVLGAAADDDGGQLLGPGSDGGEQFLLERRFLVPRSPQSRHRNRRPLCRRAGAESRFLLYGAADRGPARHRGRALPAAPGLDGRRRAGTDGAADADPLECRRNDVADLLACRYRPVRRGIDRARASLQRDAGRRVGLVHDRGHRRLALDAARRAAQLCRVAGDSRRVLSGRAHRRRQPLGDLRQYRAAKASQGPGHRHPAALHADLHDLYRTFRCHRRRPGKRHHLPLHRPRENRARPGRCRQRREHVPRLQPHHHHALLGLLHDHDPDRPPEGRVMRATVLPRIGLAAYLVVLMLPIYWLVNLSLRSNEDIMSGLSLWPHHPSLGRYFFIFNDPTWVHAFGVSLTYVAINTVISVTVALPAAYAFNRYHFVGDKHLFFWLLTNLMAPTAVYAMPFFNLYYALGLFDTVWAVALAHCLFNVPVAVWILEGFVSGVPREIDETAAIDGYSFPRFFIRIFLPLIANGVGVTAFFCFMFSWVEQLLATTLTATDALPFAAVMTRSYSAAGMDWSLLAAAGVLTMIPGAVVIWFVRNHIAKGFALGRV